MNSKHVQTFLLVSAAFFTMSAPVRSNSAQASVTAVRASQATPSTSATNRSAALKRATPSGD